MKYTFQIIVTEAICPISHTAYYHNVSIPAWHIRLVLLELERDYIKTWTLGVFLKNLAHDLLAEREANGLAIEPPQKLNTVRHELFDPTLPNNTLDHHRLHLSVTIEDYIPKRSRCHFFERFTPLFVSICSSIDLFLIGILTFCAMQFAQSTSDFLNMGYTTNLGVSLSSSIMGIFWALWDFFSGGEIVFLQDTGAMIDKKCHQLMDWCQGRAATRQLLTQNMPSTRANGELLRKLLKSLFTLACINNFYQQITNSYTQIVSMSNTIAETISLPANVFRILQWCELAFAHIDDPFIWATTFYFGFNVIDVLIHNRFSLTHRHQATAAPTIASHQDEEENEQAKQKKLEFRSLADERRHNRLARWSQTALNGPDEQRYRLLTAEPELIIPESPIHNPTTLKI